jgi:3-methyladenine DNA glycosylase AlkD
VPKIKNWGICDSFCSSLKITKDHKKQVWDFLKPYLNSQEEFKIRFGVVMLINYYIEDEYIDQIYAIFDYVKHTGYYVKMAVAWAVSICFIKYPDKTMRYLKKNMLDDFTFNKALQKIIESLCVDKEMKVVIRSMKRS